MTKTAYFASSLFSEMEQQFNERLAAAIRDAYPELTVFVPQEQAEINDKNAYADAKTIATYDTQALLRSDIMIAILDGATIDVGVATEIGIAYQAGIPIVALYSDVRQQGGTHPQKIAALQEIAESQFAYINLYTAGIVKLNGVIVSNSEQLVAAIAQYL